MIDYKLLIHLYTQLLLNKRQIKRLKTLEDMPIHIIWRPGVAVLVLDTLSQRPPMDPSCSTPPLAASPTATLDTILVVKYFLVCLIST